MGNIILVPFRARIAVQIGIVHPQIGRLAGSDGSAAPPPMHRRSLLSVVTATFLAGCGWQTTRTDEATRPGASNERRDDRNGNETAEPLPEREAGDTLIEQTGEQLILPVAKFREWTDREGWEEESIQTTNACRRFDLSVSDETIRRCEYCTIVAEDEASAIDEYETFADVSGKLKILDTRERRLQEQDVGLEIGNEAVVHQGSLATREEGLQTGDRQIMTRIRIVFRDRNVVGTIDYTERTWAGEGIELKGPRDLADLAVRLHDHWREQ
jgi:hypothetical protein